MRLIKYDNNPILSPHPVNPWENYSVCNPGVWYEDGVFYMLYRAAGSDEDHVIHFGLAKSNDGFHFKRCSDTPAVSPSKDGLDAGCIEDPRIVKIDDYYYITYAFRPYPPGRYWENENHEADKPYAHVKHSRFVSENLTNSGLLMTKDFVNYKRLGRLTSPTSDNRDVILFPERVNGKFVLLHRAKELTGEKYGTKYPAIWISYSDDLLSWGDGELLLKGEEEWEQKVGGSTPPLKTNKGWLMLYHAVDAEGMYRVGAVLLALDNPSIILGRTKNFILEPEYDYEMKGIYNGVVFPTGNVIKDDMLYVYYGGADIHCAVATAPVNELIDYILNS